MVDALFDSLVELDSELRPQPAVASGWAHEGEATVWRFSIDEDARWSDGAPVVAADVVRGLRRVADGTRPTPSLHHTLLSGVVGYVPARQGEPLAGVREVDERTVEVELTRPDPGLPVVLSHPALAPVPALAEDDPVAFAAGRLGNGPFVLDDEWVRNQFLRLVPSPTHVDQPRLDELVFRIYADDTAGEVRWGDLVTGQVLVSAVPLARRDDVAGLLGDDALRDPLLDVTTVLLTAVDDPWTQDRRVRRALSLLVDRDAIAGRTNGARVAAAAIVPPGIPGSLDEPCGWCYHDPATAARLLSAALADLEPPPAATDEPTAGDTPTDDATGAPADATAGDDRVDDEEAAGGPSVGAATGSTSGDAPTGDSDGASGEQVVEADVTAEDGTDLPTEPSGDGAATDGDGEDPDVDDDAGTPSEQLPPLFILVADDGVSVAIAQQLRDGLVVNGIDARFVAVPAVDLPTRIERLDPAVVLLRWRGSVPTAESTLLELVGQATVGSATTGWFAPELTERLQTVRSTSDPARRRTETEQLERYVLREAVVLPVLHATGDLAVAPSVRGFRLRQDGSVDLRTISVVVG